MPQQPWQSSKLGLLVQLLLKAALVNNHHFKLSKNSAISPYVHDPKYKDHKNHRDSQPQLFYHKDLDPDNLPAKATAYSIRRGPSRKASGKVC
jgi:hypothetical protein